MAQNFSSPGYAAFGRLLWMMIGPAVLIITTAHIVLEGEGWNTTADYVFFFVMAVTLLGRWLELAGGNPQTCDGEPATRKQVYRYTIVTLVLGGVVWVMANVVGNHGLIF